MKRYFIATLILAVLFPAGASAQWYLFPGGRPSKDSTTVHEGFIPVKSDEELEAELDAVWNRKVALILPLRSKETPNSNFLDFYSGVLMAADKLSNDKVRYDITVYDSTVGLPTAGELSECNLIIGPVSYDDITRMLPRVHGNYIISPLDPKASALAERFNIIQAPASSDAQILDLVKWVSEDMRGGDTVVILQSAEESSGKNVNLLALELGAAGIKYEINSTPSSYEGTVKGTCRFILVSDNDAFCASCIREIALMNLRGGHNAVYGTSKLRSINDLETESMHAAAVRITANYYANPQDVDVKRFSNAYRTLFKGEPGQWVFQGYDLMYYLGSTLSRDPDSWAYELTSNPGEGLQTDFRFDGTGKINTAVRRLRYNTNNTITIVR